MRYSDAVLEIYELIKRTPGIKQCDVPCLLERKRHYTTTNYCLRALVGAQIIERVPADKSFRLYLKGKAPAHKSEPIRRGLWQENHPMNSTSGERFFRAFDSGFDLPPVTEFPYLLRYLERLSVNADEVRATPPELIARTTTFFYHHQDSSRKAATGTTIFNPHSHSPVAANTDCPVMRRAQDERCANILVSGKHGDSVPPLASVHHLGERDSSLIPPMVLGISRVCPFAFSNHFLQSWSAEHAQKQPAGGNLVHSTETKLGTHDIFHSSLNRGVTGFAEAPQTTSGIIAASASSNLV